MSSYLRKVWAIVQKDVAAELRSKEIFSSMAIFALIVIVIFNFAFELKIDNVVDIAPGVLWVAITFAGVLGLNRTFVIEKDKGGLAGLLLCPVDRSAIYLGKLISSLIFMVTMEVVALPLFAVFFNLPIWIPGLYPVVLLGTVGFAAVGTLLAAMSVNTRTREVMLPVLLFPVVVPVLIAAVKSTGSVLSQRPWDEFAHWINLLVAFDVIFFVVCLLTFDYVVEE